MRPPAAGGPAAADRIFVRGLRVAVRVGVAAWERQAPRRLEIDLDLDFDLRTAATRDRLSDTLDYDSLIQDIVARLGAGSYRLLERVAEEVSVLCLERGATRVRVRVGKAEAVPGAALVGVEIERRRPA